MNGCVFCEMVDSRVVSDNQYAYCIRDDVPVTPLHSLIIPKRHAETLFDLNHTEILAIHELLCEERRVINDLDKNVSGFNVGVNIGKVAGQSILHCHFHVLPRRLGDVLDANGGVKNLIKGSGIKAN